MGRKHNGRPFSAVTALLLILILLFSGSAAVAAAEFDTESKAEFSGTCGDSLTWSLSAGTLTISGSGVMKDYTEDTMAPWYEYREEILRLELPDGLTRVGDLAFYGCRQLTAVQIPDSVEAIGDFSFDGCTSLELLTLGSRLESIGEYAFVECISLKALDLPDSLRTIGLKAFYRCESLTGVTIPAGVTGIGIEAFGYCKSLVSATIWANIRTLPDFLFYECENLTNVLLGETLEDLGDYAFRGCEQLDTISYNGWTLTEEQVQEVVGDGDSEKTTEPDVVDPTVDQNPESTTDPNNTDSEEMTPDEERPGKVQTVIDEDRFTISSKTETIDDVTNVEIDVTVREDADWTKIQEEVEKQLDEANDALSGGGITAVHIYLSGGEKVDNAFAEAMNARTVEIQVTAQDGSIWYIRGTETGSETSGYDLRYTLTAGDDALSEELGVSTSFYLQFQQTIRTDVEVLIQLGTAWARQNATLFQNDAGKYSLVRTAVVDDSGYAHFLLDAVSSDVGYAIGMNLPEEAQNAQIPDELAEAYGGVKNLDTMTYEVTGRSSSWGMDLGQVMGILAVVMLVLIIVVGILMFTLNKRKLRKGYVPDWEDDEPD